MSGANLESTIQFISVFSEGVYYLAPVLFLHVGVIALIGCFIGRIEKWEFLDSIYFAFVTATTVGYGDMRPHSRISKLAAIVIALIGLVLTGIIVAIALYALETAVQSIAANEN